MTLTAPRAWGTGSLHGTRARYGKGCRCAPCTKANLEYLTAWRRARGVKPQRYVRPRPAPKA